MTSPIEPLSEFTRIGKRRFVLITLPSLLQVWVNLLGLIAGVASWKSGWQATALPAPAPTPGEPEPEPLVLPAGELSEKKLAPYLDDPLKDVITEPTLDEM